MDNEEEYAFENYAEEYNQQYRSWYLQKHKEASEGFAITNLIFVYGTLQSGCGNNRLLHNCNLLGKAETDEEYYMSISGSVPFVNKNIHTTKIQGEVYEVADIDSFVQIDSLESHPEWYKREVINVNLGGKLIKAWIYFNNETSNKISINDGNYKKYITARYD